MMLLPATHLLLLHLLLSSSPLCTEELKECDVRAIRKLCFLRCFVYFAERRETDAMSVKDDPVNVSPFNELRIKNADS